jgi:autotransporter-like protein
MGRNRKAAGRRDQVSERVSQANDPVIVPETITARSTGVRRSTLLGTVAAGMLVFAYGRSAQAGPGPCLPVGGVTVTCTGDQSAGIASGTDFDYPPTTTLNVNGLTANITPGGGDRGILFNSTNSITINSDTTDGPGGPFAIMTNGFEASGIEAYSFGGPVRVTHTGNIFTNGQFAFGINGYSLGGPTSITHTGDITTRADDSDGIFAFSLAGKTNVVQTGSITTHGDYSAGIWALSPFGSSVAVTQTGKIVTHGYASDGIFAFSPSGSVTVIQVGSITTRGYDAYGIQAEALGAVTVTRRGDISTRGTYGYGIYAFSPYGPIVITNVGNIKTAGAFADGIYATVESGHVFITQTGDITVTGWNADGIDVNHGCGCFGPYGNSVVVVKAGSTITGGPGQGDGVDFDGGLVNRLINFGTITTAGENAIEGEGSGAEVVDNYGVVTGNVHLGPGANRFNNRSGGVFNAGATAYIGTGRLFSNAGTLSPGGSSTIQTTALTGNMVQTGGGQFAVDLNLGNATTDRVNVSGTANLAGTVKVAVQNPVLLTQQFTILSAAGGTTDSGLGLLASPALQASLLFPNPNDVVLDIDVDFAPGGLNRNQTAIGNNLNAILGAGGGTLGPVFAGLFNVFTLNAYKDALDQLSPEIYADTELAALYGAFDFSDNLLSCRVNGPSTAAINTEGECLWLGAKGRFIDGDATFQDIGFEETAGQFAAGAQVALNPVWRLGGGLGYQTSTLTTDTNASSDGDQLQGGLALKYNPGALLLAGVLSGAHGWYDTTRPMSFGGFSDTAYGDHELDVLQGRLHASYVLGNPGLYYKPMLDAAVTDIDLGDVREHGAGGASLLVDGGGDTVFSLSPALEMGSEWWWANGTLVRPFVRAGLTWYSEGDVTVAASFSGAPGSIAPFTIVANTDEIQADIAAGIEMISGDDSNLRVFYDGQFGDRLAVHAAGFKASIKY